MMTARLGFSPPRAKYPFMDSCTVKRWDHLLMRNIKVVARADQTERALEYMHQFTMLAVDAEDNRRICGGDVSTRTVSRSSLTFFLSPSIVSRPSRLYAAIPRTS